MRGSIWNHHDDFLLCLAVRPPEVFDRHKRWCGCVAVVVQVVRRRDGSPLVEEEALFGRRSFTEEKTQLSFETTSSLLCLSLCWTPIKFDIATLLFLSGARENHHLLFLPKTASSSTSRRRQPRVFLKKLQLFVWRREIIIHGFGSWNWTHLLTFCAAKTPNYPPFAKKDFCSCCLPYFSCSYSFDVLGNALSIRNERNYF